MPTLFSSKIPTCKHWNADLKETERTASRETGEEGALTARRLHQGKFVKHGAGLSDMSRELNVCSQSAVPYGATLVFQH